MINNQSHQFNNQHNQYSGAAIAIILAAIIPSISITPILPKMQAEFSYVPQIDMLVQLSYALPGLMAMLVAPFTGIISDRIGRGIIVITASFLAAVLGTLPIILDSIWTIIASRAALGICQGALIVCTSALIADYFQNEQRERVLGIKFGAVGVANILLFAVAGVISENNWTNVFMLYLWGAGATAIALLYLKHPPQHEEKESRDMSFTIPWKQVMAPYVGALLGAASFTLLFGHLPFLLEVRGISSSPAFAGIITSVAATGMFISAFLYPKIIARMTAMNLWVLCFALVALGCSILAISANITGVIAGVATIGLGCGATSPNSLNMLFEKVSPAGRGKVAGIQTMFFFFGIFGGPLIGVALMRIFNSVDGIFFTWAGIAAVTSIAFLLASKKSSVTNPSSIKQAKTL
ncbi:MAG: MFS transporter [Pseudomonadales bacterium]|nr:MFS transporter [Pseudomonadales bacterium]